MLRKPLLWLIAAALTLAVAGAVAWHAAPPAGSSAAPQLVLTSLKGEKLALQAWNGRVVLVNFWAPSCAPCVHEMPMLAETYARLHARGLEVVGVAANFDPPNVVLDYVETRRIPFPVALDLNGQAVQAFGGLQAVPATYVIGRNGRIVWHVEGVLDPVSLAHLLEEQLGPA